MCGGRQASVSNMEQTLKSIWLRLGDEGGHNSLLQNRGKIFYAPSLGFVGGVRVSTVLLEGEIFHIMQGQGPKCHRCTHLC